jgi:hypothetical protein
VKFLRRCDLRLRSAGFSRLRWGLFVWALLLGSPQAARAHQSSVVYSDIAAVGRDVIVTLQIASSDLYEALGLSQDRPATAAEARAGTTRITAYLLARLSVKNHGHDCAGEPEENTLLDKGNGFFFVQKLRYRCSRTL